jgi:hypothetical protein
LILEKDAMEKMKGGMHILDMFLVDKPFK